MWNWIFYPWYQKRVCESCGNEFYRVREQSMLDEFLDLFRSKKKEGMNYVCSMGCALSLFNRLNCEQK
jgi:hypothetical protein